MTMNSKIIVESIIKSKNGIAKVADLVEGGVSRQSIKKMYADGYIKRISRGYYTWNLRFFITVTATLCQE